MASDYNNSCPIDLLPTFHSTHAVQVSCVQSFYFSNLNKIFFGYFDPENIFMDDENKYFSGWANRYFG